MSWEKNVLIESDIAVLGRALKLVGSGTFLQESEFTQCIGVELADFRNMLKDWPAWDDGVETQELSPECRAIRNTLLLFLRDDRLTDTQLRGLVGTDRAGLHALFRRWAAPRRLSWW